MAERRVAGGCTVIVVASALAHGICASGSRSAYSQDAAPVQEQAKGSARTVAEVRGLVAELELLAERQHAQLQTTEASLRRAQALLKELEGGESHQPRGQQRQTSHSREEERKLPDQAAAEKKEWRWAEEQASALASARRLGDDYGMQIATTPGKPWSSTITVTRGGRAVYSWEGHPHSVFVRAGDVLYYADFNPRMTGCAIVAFDLKDEKLLWRTHLWGYPVVGHSKYSNRINLEVGSKNLTVYGNEAYGSYIELVDRETGKTVGHRVAESRVR